MLDIRLNEDGDIAISKNGDISTTESVRQAVMIRLRWIYDEWRLGPELGFPWFEEVFIKNPNTIKIKNARERRDPESEGGQGGDGHVGRLQPGEADGDCSDTPPPWERTRLERR